MMLNILTENIYTINRKSEDMLEASKEVGLEVNMEKTTYMVMSRHQNVEQDHNLLVADKLFENVTNFRYLVTTVTNIKIAFRNKLIADETGGMLATFLFRVFCLSVSSLKTCRLKYTKP
jgi:hypothetical protein